MSIFDDVAKGLDKLFGNNQTPSTNPTNNLWNSVAGGAGNNGVVSTGVGPDVTNQNQGFTAPTAPAADPYAQDPARIQAIQQNNARAFKDVIINPRTLDSAVNKCTIPLGQFNDFFEYTSPQQFVPGASLIQWRTVVIPFAGNFLRVEYMPARRNYYDLQFVNSAQVNGDANTNNSLPDQSNEGYTDGRDSSGLVLVQFDAPDATVFLANHNDTFNAPYNAVLISMPAGACRVRVTVGYNVSMRPAPDNAIMASQLHMYPGKGLFQQGGFHPSPFCIDLLDSGDSAWSRVTIPFQNPIGHQAEYTLFNQVNFVRGNDGGNIGLGGVAVGWITGVNVAMISQGATSTMNYELVIENGNDSNRIIKRLWKRNTFSPAEQNQSYSDYFHTPIRFVLRNGYKLVLRFQGSNQSGQFLVNGSIIGYSMGEPRAFTAVANASNSIPYYLPTFTENPYPADWGGAQITGVIALGEMP